MIKVEFSIKSLLFSCDSLSNMTVKLSNMAVKLLFGFRRFISAFVLAIEHTLRYMIYVVELCYLASLDSGNDIVIGAEGLEFDSLAGEIEHNVTSTRLSCDVSWELYCPMPLR